MKKTIYIKFQPIKKLQLYIKKIKYSCLYDHIFIELIKNIIA